MLKAVPLPAPCIELRDAKVTYANGLTALHPATLAIRRGEFLVLLGASGAGKSTLLRSLNGLVPLTSGTLHAAEIGDVVDAPALRAHRRRTAMIFQQHQLIGRLDALSNVLTGRLAFHHALRTLLPLPEADRRIALACLDRVGLLDRALERVDRLSGGQQQRVGIARALAQQPLAVLADEPVASLDPATARLVLGLIHDVCKADGIAAVVSLHQIDLAREFADRIVGLHAGRIVFDAAPAALDAATLDRLYAGRDPNDARTAPAPQPATVGTR